MLSGIQHYAFCPRQWALIHVECQWADNTHTAIGELTHKRAHDEKKSEMRGDILTIRGMRVSSDTLGITGICDVVEFHRCEDGIILSNREGHWSVYPVEYKKGKPKAHSADELQLCAEAMCLEEMLCCHISEGSLYYGETRSRVTVCLTDELRGEVIHIVNEMHHCMDRGYTPFVSKHKGCSSCSLADLCLPVLHHRENVAMYLEHHCHEEKV